MKSLFGYNGDSASNAAYDMCIFDEIKEQDYNDDYGYADTDDGDYSDYDDDYDFEYGSDHYEY